MREFDNLTKTIYKIITQEPFNAETYSKIYSSILLNFINNRLDKLLPNFTINYFTDNHSKPRTFLNHLNETFLYEKHRVFELFFLIPQLERSLKWDDNYGIFCIKKILTELETKHGILIEESQLDEHWKARHWLKLPDAISEKYKKIYFHYLKLAKSMDLKQLTSLFCLKYEPFDPEFPEDALSILNYGYDNMTLEKLIMRQESKILRFLIPSYTNIKMQNFIHSIYKFKNEDEEIENLLKYKEENDIWNLSRINSNFRFSDKSSKKTFKTSKHKLDLLESINMQPDLLNKYVIHPESSSKEFKKGDKYIDEDIELTKLRNKIKRCYEEWIYDPEVVDWDTYWIKMEKRNSDLNIKSQVKQAKEESGLLNSQTQPIINDDGINRNRNSITKKGISWLVRYNNIERIFKDINGIHYFSLCLKSPGHNFKYTELMHAKDINNASYSNEIQSIKESLKNIRNEISLKQTEFHEDPTANEVVLEKLEKEKEKLLNILFSKKLKSKDYTQFDKKISDTFTKSCRLAKAHCKEIFPEFYQHINNYIKWRNGIISYSGKLDWD
jgi:hypothetical protein